MELSEKDKKKLEKRNAQIEAAFQKLHDRAIKQGQKRHAILIEKKKKLEEKRQKERDKILNRQKLHKEKIEKNRRRKELDILFGIAPKPKRYKKDPSEFKGYYYDHGTGKFRVQFRFKGKQYRKKMFTTPEAAHQSYLEERAKMVDEYENSLIDYEATIARRETEEKSEFPF